MSQVNVFANLILGVRVALLELAFRLIASAIDSRGDNRNQQEHQLKALQTDLENAQNNISSLQRQLDDLMD